MPASPERRLSSLNEYIGEIWSAIKLSHAQVVFRFRSEEDRRNQRLQFLTGKCFAVGATLDALLFCAGPGSALRVCDLAVAWAPVAFHVLCGVTFVTEEFSPAVNQSLSDGGIFGSSRTKVTAVTTITYHLCAFAQDVPRDFSMSLAHLGRCLVSWILASVLSLAYCASVCARLIS